MRFGQALEIIRAGTPKATGIMCSILRSPHLWAGIGIYIIVIIKSISIIIIKSISIIALVCSCLGDCQDGSDGCCALSQVQTFCSKIVSSLRQSQPPSQPHHKHDHNQTITMTISATSHDPASSARPQLDPCSVAFSSPCLCSK